MKLFVTVMVLFFTFQLTAQQKIEKNPGDFDELKVFDLINVTLIKSDTAKVLISGDNQNDVSVENDDGVLKIKMDLKERFDGNKTEVTVYYTELTLIDVNEGAYVNSDEIFEQYKLELKAQEGGFIKLKLNVTEAEVKAVTGGEVEIEGKATRLDVSINTGGKFKGENFATQSTYVAVRAAGDAYVNASELVDAKIRIGGSIYIYGHPAQVNESKVIGGRIKRMD